MQMDTNGQRILLSFTRPLVLSGKVWQSLKHMRSLVLTKIVIYYIWNYFLLQL